MITASAVALLKLLTLLPPPPECWDYSHTPPHLAKAVKFLGENTGINLCDLGFGKVKINQNKKFVCIKEYPQESKKTTYRMGANICKSHNFILIFWY
jgi:hypothetical protein